jgi:hypothetical protein
MVNNPKNGSCGSQNNFFMILKTAVKENENGADTRKHAGF